MALYFVYGNSGSGKSEYIYNRTASMAAESPYKRFYVVVPEQATMQAQKSLVAHSGKNVIMNIDVVSFERLAYRIFDELGVHKTVMEETGKNLILRKIATEKLEDITILRGNIRKMGYIGELKSVISEFMQYGITADDLEDMIRGLKPDSTLAMKLSDILVMYRSFHAYLGDDYMTSETVLQELCMHLESSGLIRDAVFVFDGFTGFTPVQMKLLRHLMNFCSDMYVTVTLASDLPFLKKPQIHDLFYLSYKMVDGLRIAASEENFPIGETICIEPGEHSRHAANPQLAHLEQNLFRVPMKEWSGDPEDSLHMISLPSPKDELEFAASEICSLMQKKGYRYRDFAIVSGDVARYSKYADSVFSMYHISYFTDEKKTILYHPLTEMIRALLEIAESDYSCESVFRYLRTGFAGFSDEETDLLENYCIEKGIRGHGRWSAPFRVPTRQHGRIKYSEDVKQQELAMLNHLRVRFWDQTREFYTCFTEKGAPISEQVRVLYRHLTSLSVEEQLKEKQEAFEAQGEEILAGEYRQIYKIVIDLLDKLFDLLGEEKVSIHDFSDILEAGFTAAKVGNIPPGNDCVILGDIERSRLDHVKVLFFLGVNDGLIPKSLSGGGILSQFDREFLEQQNITLAPTAKEQSFIQRFYLYLNMTKPSEALYVTYARMGEDGKAIRPSYLVETLRRLFPELDVTEFSADRPFEALTPGSSIESYLKGLSLAKKGEVLEQWKALHHWFMTHGEWAKRVTGLFDAAFSCFEGENLSENIAEQLYGSILYYSVTRLESYARCAFAHFLEYGLKLAPRGTYSFEIPDMGTMFHLILQKYCEGLEKKYDWDSVTDEQQEELLQAVMEEAVLEMPNESLLENERSRYVLERIYRIMKRSIQVITEQIKSGDFLPWGYEVDFLHASELSGKMLMQSDDADVLLTGKIDRVDTYETDSEIYVRVVDYKSGNTKFQLLNVFYGQQLQLVVYLNMAMERLRRENPGKKIVPGGIFYFHLDDPMIDGDEKTEDEIMQGIMEKLRLNGLVSLEPEAYLHMDRGLTGKSNIIPLTLNRDGSPGKKGSSGTTTENFGLLLDYADHKIKDTAQRIEHGDIEVRPFERGDHTGCDYCAYRGICGFDQKIPGYKYHREETLDNEAIWNQMREQLIKEEKNE